MRFERSDEGETLILEGRTELTIARAALANFTHTPASLWRHRSYLRLAHEIDAARSEQYKADSDSPLQLSVKESRLCLLALEHTAAREDTLPNNAQRGYRGLLEDAREAA